jgi:hypothetical protein
MLRTSHGGWRGMIAGVLAYALVLQGFFFAAAAGPLVGGSSDSVAFAGFELCTHGGGGAALPDAPAPAYDDHCPFCIAGAVFMDCAPPSAPNYNTVEFTHAAWSHTTPRLIAFLINRNAWPRGPPIAA